MIITRFNSKKTTQAACRLLHKNGGKMNYMKLIKELYLIDRTCLDGWHRTLTGDTYFSMKEGPVLSNVLDNISSFLPTGDSYWTKYIRSNSRYNVSLETDNCPNSEFSARERKVIDEIYIKFKDMNEWALVEWCHRNLSEWTDIQEGRVQIFIKDILKALGRTKEEIDEIEKEISSAEFAKEMFNDE